MVRDWDGSGASAPAVAAVMSGFGLGAAPEPVAVAVAAPLARPPAGRREGAVLRHLGGCHPGGARRRRRRPGTSRAAAASGPGSADGPRSAAGRERLRPQGPRAGPEQKDGRHGAGAGAGAGSDPAHCSRLPPRGGVGGAIRHGGARRRRGGRRDPRRGGGKGQARAAAVSAPYRRSGPCCVGDGALRSRPVPSGDPSVSS